VIVPLGQGDDNRTPPPHGWQDGCMQLSQAARTMPHSGIRLVAELVAQRPDAIKLHIGDTDFPTSDHIAEAAARAARDGFTRYPPSGGYPSLRELLVEKLRRRNAVEVTADRVVVTTGGAGALFTSFMTILDPGDEALLPDPGWSTYPSMLHSLGMSWRGYPLDPARGYEPDLEALEGLVGPRTKAIVVNSPGNPTGAVYARATLDHLARFAERHELWLISDECYDELVFEGEHVSMARLADPDRTVSVFSFSKTYAMTGWRLGYLVAPAAAAGALARAQVPAYASASSVVQKAGEAALTGPQDSVREMREAYRRRRDASVGQLDDAGLGYVRPSGAFYLMVDVSRGGTSAEVARRLLEEEGVAVVPGDAFGPGGEGMVRVVLAAPDADIAEGLSRLARLLARSPALRVS
jgi:aspartate/methionine/tyrosine aminotransferase